MFMYVSKKWSNAEINGFARDAHARSSNIVEFSKLFGIKLHSNTIRDNGRHYKEHLCGVAEKTRRVVHSEKYGDAAEAAGYLHDAHEDVDGVVILDPCKCSLHFTESPPSVPGEHAGKLIINSELAVFGMDGGYASFIIYMATREKHNRTKPEYVENILRAVDSAPTQELKELATITLILKTADLDENTDSGETYDREYGLRAARMMYEVDAAQFIEQKEHAFTAKKMRFAIDNLSLFLPEIEKRLLIEPGLEGNQFNPQMARDNPHYDYDRMKALLASVYTNSIEIFGTAFPQEIIHHITSQIGRAKVVAGFQGYTPIIEKVNSRKEGALQGNHE
ncbi:MAG: hypothetical protein ABIG39_05050 [Candidatus Micrarchaeota archaeon]